MSRLRNPNSIRFRSLYSLALEEIGTDAVVKAHRKVLRSLAYGNPCVFGTNVFIAQSSHQFNYLTPIKGCFVRWLMSSQRAHQWFSVKRIEIIGAQIDGVLDLNSVTSNMSLSLIRCRLGCPEFSNACLTHIDLSGSEIIGLKAHNSQLQSLKLSGGLHSKGEIILLGARIVSSLNLSDSIFEGNPCTGKSISVDGARIGRDVFLRGTQVKSGEARFCGVHIAGSIYFDGATIDNPCGLAILLDNSKIGGAVVLAKNFVAKGVTSLTCCSIEDGLILRDAVFDNSRETRIPQADKPYCLLAQTTTVKGVLILQRTQFSGPVDLSSISIGTLNDYASSWPSEIQFGNFSLERLSFRSPSNAKDRLELLSRTPIENSFDPHPYLEFARTLSRQGAQSEGHKIMERYWWRRIATNLRGLRNSISNIIRKLFKRPQVYCNSPPPDGTLFLLGSAINGAFTGFGYARWRSLAWLLLLVVISAWTFGMESAEMAPVAAVDCSEGNDSQSLAFSNPIGWLCNGIVYEKSHCYTLSTSLKLADSSNFNAWLFSLDTVIPLVNLRYSADWIPTSWWAREILLPLYVAIGWLLVSLFVASFSRVIRKL